MFNYFLKRLGFSILALIILLLLVFFLMQAVPGYPIQRENTDTDASYLKKLENAGLLDNVFVQLWYFIKDLFVKGEFGKVYSGVLSVTETMLNPIKYTFMIAGPSFILAVIIGISLGIVSAYYRGKVPDIIINLIAVLFISVPSFVFALYLIQLAGLIGLPTQFLVPGDGVSVSDIIKSMITPILSMTLSSISVIIYYTRNELVDVFKQDYIKTALAKGLTFKQVVFKHSLRNAAIPIVASLLPAFMTILSGSIIIEKFFNVPGTASILVDSINQKELYIVMFSAIFYSSIYFLLQIFIDMLYTVIDPRIVLSEKNNLSMFSRAKSFLIRKRKINLIKNENKQYNFLIRNAIEEEEVIESQSLFINSPTENNVEELNVNYMYIENSENDVPEISSEQFKTVDIYSSFNSEQIVGKPTKYITDLWKRFFSSKPATVCTIIFSIIILLAIFIPLSNGNNVYNPISQLPASIIAYLPPRIPGLGISGITSVIMSDDIYQTIFAQFQDSLWDSKNQIGGQWEIVNFNPYKIPGMSNVVTLLGTDGLGRDWWSLLWYSTSKSLFLAILVSICSVIIGTIYGSIAGSKAGSMTDTILMRVVEIISGVPLILWIMILGLVVSDGSLNMFTIAFALILTNWMWPAITARTYIIKYKDAEFVQAARTLGASEARIIYSHMLPNISGRLFVRLVNMIPRIIFFEASLVFLGLKSTEEISLGTMIETARLNPYPHLLLAPTLMIVGITLCSQIISNNLNDALDPKVSG